MFSYKFGSHMQTLMQTQKMDQLEQEVHELRGEVTTLRAEVERLTSLVSSLMVAKDSPLVQQRSQPLCQPMCMKRPRQQVPQQPQSFTTQNQAPQPFTSQNQAPQQLIPQSQAPQQLILQNQARKASQFDPIPIKYATLLPILLKKRLVQTRPPPRVPNPLPSWYRPDLKCDFHQGAPGHDAEQCYALKEEVQKLIGNNTEFLEDPDIKVLLQQQHLASHSVAAIKPINTVQNPGYQPQFQPSQQHLAHRPVAAVMSVTNALQSSGYQPQFQQYQQQPRQRISRKRIDPIPMTYAELFPKLLERNLVYPKAPLPMPAKLSAQHRPDLFCAFHQGAPGHDIEHCCALQKIVQKLIQKNLIPFEEF